MIANDVTPEPFRQAMSRFASGVTVVTTLYSGQPYGLTVSAFCSVSLDPLLVLVSLQQSSQTLTFIEKSGCFAVNLLTAQQQPLAVPFARKDRQGKLLSVIPHHLAGRMREVSSVLEALARAASPPARTQPS